MRQHSLILCNYCNLLRQTREKRKEKHICNMNDADLCKGNKIENPELQPNADYNIHLGKQTKNWNKIDDLLLALCFIPHINLSRTIFEIS